MATVMDERYNEIDDSARISPRVKLGWYNYIGPNVEIGDFGGPSDQPITIGDCNKFHANTRILCDGEVYINDWSTFHNHIDVLGTSKLVIGHNFWMGQYGYMDTRGELTIGHGVRIGCNAHIWTHAAAGELIEGCTLFAVNPTVIEDDAWLVGDNITVSSGIRVGYRSITLPHSVITRDTNPYETYAGVPAKSMGLKHWREVTIREKFDMMTRWMYEFMRDVLLRETAPSNAWTLDFNSDANRERDLRATLSNVFGPRIVVGVGMARGGDFGNDDTYFDLEGKRYTKRLTWLERKFYTYIQNHKARFLPYAETYMDYITNGR